MSRYMGLGFMESMSSRFGMLALKPNISKRYEIRRKRSPRYP
jgi:hypothetical protein